MSAVSRSFGAVDVESFTGPLKTAKKKRATTISDVAFEKLRRAADESMKSGDWSHAGAQTMVALFAILHERVYGVACADLTPSKRLFASFSAARMLEREFSADVEAMAMFLRWTWIREKGREQWRRANGQDGGSISWQLQFNGRLLTDYRLALARQHAQPRKTG